jgi:BirA family biotin operon repressor/biotin-[acetyl-CoA-carboxylase] ligase
MNLKRLQLNIIQLDTVDSTNNYAAKLIKKTKVVNGMAVLTKRQLAGKGQRGAEWVSQPGENLTSSIILFPNIEVSDSFYLNIISALAIKKTLADFEIFAEIKWPNDVFVNQKKIAGILIENQLMATRIKSSIVGIGLNVNQKHFGDNLIANSIYLMSGVENELSSVFIKLHAYLDFYFDLLLNKQYGILKNAYLKAMYQRGELRKYEDENGVFEGEIIGIDQKGKLLVKAQNKLSTYDFKEIKFL